MLGKDQKVKDMTRKARKGIERTRKARTAQEKISIEKESNEN